MQHIVSIDDKTQSGRILLDLLRNYSKNVRSIEFLTNEEFEAKEDKTLLKMMEEDKKSGKADTKTVLDKLGIK